MRKAVRRELFLALVGVGDISNYVLAWLIVWQHGGLQTGRSTVDSTELRWVPFCVFLGASAWYLAHHACGLYHSRRLSTGIAHLADAVRAAIFGLVVGFLPFAALLNNRLPVSGAPLFFAITVFISVCIRLAVRTALKRCRISGRNLNHVVLIGANSRALDLANVLREKHELGYSVLGFVDTLWDGRSDVESAGFKILSTFDGFGDVVRRTAIDEVIVCLPMASFYDRAQGLARICEEQGILVRFLADMFRPSSTIAQTDVIEGRPVVTFCAPLGSEIGLFIKNVVDRASALVLLVLSSPLLILIGAAIKVTSTGPVFFTQTRLGRNKRLFALYKFRTMVVDAEARLSQIEHLNEVQGAAFKMRDDPRVTKIGRWLRVTSLDELPQLVNVLRGDMSLVGPRPLPRRDWEGLEKDWHRRRFSVRPGISCLWQVNGRHSLSFDQWMELDIKYIETWSLWLDVKILLKTIPAVFKGTGAS